MANPLREEDLSRIDKALQGLDEAEEEAERAIRAQIDVGDLMERIRTERRRLIAIRSAYFPGR